jgi:SAM-dependent methyltransferase
MSGHVLYDEEFYSNRRGRVTSSAEAIMGVVFDLCSIESIIDFGCGTGTWINTAQSFGAKRVLGIEGHWLEEKYLDNPYLEILRYDLSRPINIKETFDLAISLEVAEHLPADRAETFVEDICRTSKKVLFGAAIPNQGGVGHLNEQWQSYWATLFLNLDYKAFDVIRPKIWSNPEIPFWYRQNTVLYIHQDELDKNNQIFSSSQATKPTDLNIVHPQLYDKNLQSHLAHQLENLRFSDRLKIAAGLPSGLVAAIAKRLKG